MIYRLCKIVSECHHERWVPLTTPLCTTAYMQPKTHYGSVMSAHSFVSPHVLSLQSHNHWNQIWRDGSLWPWNFAVLVLAQNTLSPSDKKPYACIAPDQTFLSWCRLFIVSYHLTNYGWKSIFVSKDSKADGIHRKLSFTRFLQVTKINLILQCFLRICICADKKVLWAQLARRSSVYMSVFFNQLIDLEQI